MIALWRTWYRIVFLVLAFAVVVVSAFLQLANASGLKPAKSPISLTRRALLIGINKYNSDEKSPALTETPNRADRPNQQRGKFSNLDGPANDVREMTAVLSRYGFNGNTTLLDHEATRDAIIKSIETLIQKSSRGDIALIYYSGHGSRVRNSKNGEAKGYDESIVPADSNRGARDIRDKELAELFLKAVDQGVVLTAIFDSCHSGSVARGSSDNEKVRGAPFDENDVKEEPKFSVPPEEKGALIISAAQDYEQAKERKYNNEWRGNFSQALIEVLNQPETQNQSASLIFQRVIGKMEFNNVREQPVLAGNSKRLNASLFDAVPIATQLRRSTVSKIDKNEIELAGGLANGFGVGSEFQRDDSSKKEPVRLKVIKMIGLSNCRSVVLSGNFKSVSSGDVFVLTRWESQQEMSLKVWLPPAVEQPELDRITRKIQSTGSQNADLFIDDPTEKDPNRLIQYADDGWQSWITQGKTEKIALAAYLDKFAPRTDTKETVFISVPPSTDFRDAIIKEIRTNYPGIEITKSSANAAYSLLGRINNGKTEYAWVRIGVTEHDAEKGGVPLPLRSGWFTQADDVGEAAATLGRVSNWLQIKSSTDQPFPFKLALRNSVTGEVAGGEVFEGQKYELILVPDEAAKNANALRPIPRQRVYVFIIDRDGTSTLLFPRSNVENLFPLYPDHQDAANYDKPIKDPILIGKSSSFAVSEPFGLDNYVMLASDQSIPDPAAAFNWQGAKPKGKRGETQNALSRLVMGLSSSSRSATPDEPVNWSINRLIIRSKKQ